MTYVPVCSYDGHFWPKKKCLFYIAIGTGTDFNRYRLRFCPFHAAAIDEYLAEHESVITDLAARSGNGWVPHCLSGGEPIDEGGTQFFITGYPTQDERKDYWGKVCSDHGMPPYLKDHWSND